MSTYTATYSPEDNKLRLYAVSRLDPDEYARVRAAGFIWAPKQKLFVAPMWTPDREDLLIEMAGDIGDEDQSLIDRAEDRAERFEEYRDKRAEDAERARKAVSAIADNIPLGQPILVGHHSERRARKDAERIENGMRRAVNLWKTSQYWTARAAGAIRHAKYKERPDVRARRIKGIEADKRKREKTRDRSLKLIAAWEKPLDTPSDDGMVSPRRRVIALANYDGGYYARAHDFRRRDADGRPNGDIYHNGPLSLWDAAGGNINGYDPDLAAVATPEEVRDKAIRNHRATIAYGDRWIEHYENRLTYERAMLAEAGGLITDRSEYPIVPGGRVLVRGEWATVIRVNRKDGKITSVTTNARYVGIRGIEEVKDYQPPTAEAAAAAKAVTKQPPIVNVDEPGAVHMTKAEFAARKKHSDFWHYATFKAAGEHAAYRQAMGVKPGGSFERVIVFLTDQKVKPKPRAAEQIERPKLAGPERVIAPRAEPVAKDAAPGAFEQLENQLRAGVQVVSAPQLFPTPADVAARVIELADIRQGQTVLEPSAGTGHLIVAAINDADPGAIVAVEINHALAAQLRSRFNDGSVTIRRDDFLDCTPDAIGRFDRIVMNPPFQHGADIQHITHAREFLKPGGRLVAVCAAGPRQREAFKDETWIDLPAGSFKEQGTGVNTAIVVIDREADRALPTLEDVREDDRPTPPLAPPPPFRLTGECAAADGFQLSFLSGKDVQ